MGGQVFVYVQPMMLEEWEKWAEKRITVSVIEGMCMEQGFSIYEAFNLIMEEEENRMSTPMVLDATIRGFSSHREFEEGTRVVSAGEMAETQTFIPQADELWTEDEANILAQLASNVQYEQVINDAGRLVEALAQQMGLDPSIVRGMVLGRLMVDMGFLQNPGPNYTVLAQ